MTDTPTELTDAEVARMMLALMACDTAWRPTDQLLKVTAGRVKRDQMLRVLSDLHSQGKLDHTQREGWRFTRPPELTDAEVARMMLALMACDTRMAPDRSPDQGHRRTREERPDASGALRSSHQGQALRPGKRLALRALLSLTLHLAESAKFFKICV